MLALLALAMTLTACKKQTTQKPPAVTKEPVVKQEPEAPKPTWPLTGLPLDDNADASLLNRRPLSVKIENLRPVRPQMGLNSADIVYETVAEGGITRFNCLFDSQIPDQVGPVRSARLSDLWIVPQYKGLFFYSGSNDQVDAGLRANDMTAVSFNAATSLYQRVKGKSAPHNLFLALSKAYDKATSLGVATQADAPISGPDFGELSSEVATSSGQSMELRFSSYSDVKWTWDAASGLYLRENDGAAHRDILTGDQIGASNVVVLWATYTPQAAKDPAGNGTYDITLGGEGKATIFRNGQRIDGTWKADKNTPPTFSDAAGHTITLSPGKTWFEVPSPDIAITSN